MNTKQMVLTIAVTGIIAAVAIAPMLVDSVLARKTTTVTCNGEPGPCPGNSGSNDNDNKCEASETKAGNGNGGGEIKDSSSSC